MTILSRLITARGALSAAILAVLAFLATVGVHLPDGFGPALTKALDQGLVFVAVLVGVTPAVSLAHHAEPPAAAAKSSSSMLIGGLLLALLLPGCSSFMHFSDPSWDDVVGKLCGEQAEAHRAEIEAEAKASALSPADLLVVFEEACTLRVKRGADVSSDAGMVAVRQRAAAARGAQ